MECGIGPWISARPRGRPSGLRVTLATSRRDSIFGHPQLSGAAPCRWRATSDLRPVWNPTRPRALMVHRIRLAGQANGHHQRIPEPRRRMPPHGALDPGVRSQGRLEPNGRALAKPPRERKGASATTRRRTRPAPPGPPVTRRLNSTAGLPGTMGRARSFRTHAERSGKRLPGKGCRVRAQGAHRQRRTAAGDVPGPCEAVAGYGPAS
jgi:hypothetical protein